MHPPVKKKPSGLKMRELMKATGLPRSTLLHYVDQGLLPEPVRMGRNVASYTPDCIERVQLIRTLQKNKRLTLSEIRGYMQSAARLEDIRALLSLSDTVFGPDDGTRYTRQHVQETSGLSAATLGSLMDAGLIIPRSDSDFDEQDVAIASMFAQSLSWGLKVRDFTFYARCARDLVEHEIGIRARLIGGLGIEANAALTEEMTRSARVYRAYVFDRTFQRRAVATGSLEEGDRP